MHMKLAPPFQAVAQTRFAAVASLPFDVHAVFQSAEQEQPVHLKHAPGQVWRCGAWEGVIADVNPNGATSWRGERGPSEWPPRSGQWLCVGVETDAGRVMVGEQREPSVGTIWTIVAVVERSSLLCRSEKNGSAAACEFPAREVARWTIARGSAAPSSGEEQASVPGGATWMPSMRYERGEMVMTPKGMSRLGEGGTAGASGQVAFEALTREIDDHFRRMGEAAASAGRMAQRLADKIGRADYFVLPAGASFEVVRAVDAPSYRCPKCRALAAFECVKPAQVLAESVWRCPVCRETSGEADLIAPVLTEPVSDRETRRREIDAVLREDARRFPAFAEARRAAVMAGLERGDKRGGGGLRLDVAEVQRLLSDLRAIEEGTERPPGGGPWDWDAHAVYRRMTSRPVSVKAPSPDPSARARAIRETFPGEQSIAAVFALRS